MSGAGVMLSVRGLTKRFGGTLALDGVDLEVEEGSFACLIGPSGCGKTTCLRILAGLEAPSSGAVISQGKDVTGLPAAARGVGMVFQSYALFPNMTAAQNVDFGLPRTMKPAERRQRVAELLGVVGLGSLADRRPAQLSGGQQQRVAIARALAPEPRILLLDEPLSALDPQVRERLRGELKALQRRLGVTTVMVTHDQVEALAIADRIVVLRDGRVEQVGAPREIYDRPANAFVAGFVGAINQLPARVVAPGRVEIEGGGQLSIDTGDRGEGQAVRVGVRPEALKIVPANAAGGLAATVGRREFLGASVRLEASLAGGGHGLLIDLPAASALPAEGETVGLAFPFEHLRLFGEA